MNCSQCQAPNGPDTAFCGNCGAQLAAARAGGYASSPDTPPGYSAAGAPAGYGAPGGSGYGPPSGSGYGAPGGSGYGPPSGSGYGAPGGSGAPPSSGYGPASGQAPTGYPQNQYQQGQYQQNQQNQQNQYQQNQYQQGQYQQGPSGPAVRRSSGLPPINFDLARLTKVDKIVTGATLVTMISLWLPWYSGTYSVVGAVETTGSVSGTGDHGWLWLEFILALALLAYLVARAAWDELPFRLPVAHTPLLIAGTGLQFLLILVGFLALPSTHGVQGFSVSWDFGAFLALIASIVAVGPLVYPSIKSYLDNRKAAV